MEKILTIDNKKEEKILRRKTSEFDFNKYNKKQIRELIKTMRETMEKAEGIGLSANQIGWDMKFFVAKVANKSYAVFNPEIIKESSEKLLMDEACLSVPGLFGPVERPEKVILTGFDANNKKLKIKAWGLLARVFQHESDHLNGRLFIDRAKEIYKMSDSPENKFEKTKI